MDDIRGLLDGIRPEPIISVSAWSETYRYLSSKSSAEPGRYDLSRTPYLREILDKMSNHDPCQEVVIMKGAQVGLTEAGLNVLGYGIHISPSPMLIVMPTVETMKRNSKIRIAPMLEATPVLRDRVKPARSRAGENTTLQKEFPGGVLVMAGANSAAGLRSMPARILMLDEIDAYPLDLDGEGSPIALAEARTRTYPNRKVLKISTPTVEGASAIEAEFDTTDKRYYHVPCPHCGSMQQLVYEQIRKTDTGAEYECIDCHDLIEERMKTEMLRAGEWVASDPSRSTAFRAGYHLNSLYSPYGWFSWTDAISMHEEAVEKKDEELLKVFTNTVLGKTFAPKAADKIEWERIYDRRDLYKPDRPPAEVCFLTAGVDVQQDRLEASVLGWGTEQRCWVVSHRVLLGSTSEVEVWKKLTLMLHETFISEDGRNMQIRFMCVDSGYNTQSVYEWAAKQPQDRVAPIKGVESLSLPVSSPRQAFRKLNGKLVRFGGLKVWNVGTSVLKSDIYGRLKMNRAEAIPPRFISFPQFAPDYFRGLVSEQLRFKTLNGQKKYYWHKHYDRNEPLDMMVYGFAAAHIIGLSRMTDADYEALAAYRPRRIETVSQAEPVRTESKPRPRRDDSFWKGR